MKGVDFENDVSFFEISSSFWEVPHKIPAIVCHHVLIPSALIPFLYNFDVLVESFYLLFIVVSQFIREPVEMAEEKMNFSAHVSTELSYSRQ